MYRREISTINGAFRIEIDHDLCIGSGTCISSAPDVFRLDDNGQAVVIGTPSSIAVVIEAAADCPSEAIAVDLEDPIAS